MIIDAGKSNKPNEKDTYTRFFYSNLWMDKRLFIQMEILANTHA